MAVTVVKVIVVVVVVAIVVVIVTLPAGVRVDIVIYSVTIMKSLRTQGYSKGIYFARQRYDAYPSP